MTLQSGLSRGGSGGLGGLAATGRLPPPPKASHQEHRTRSRADFKGLPSQPATELLYD